MKTIDARQLPNNIEVQTDICIVGAGAVGIAIALELQSTTLDICLIEGGDLSFDSEVQSLYEIENIGYSRRETMPSRNRYFGGTTNTWTGRCLRLDPIDFDVRDWIPNSGWPITYYDLLPYYERAALRFKLPDFEKIKSQYWPNHSAYRDEQEVFYNKEFAPVVSLRGRTSINFRKAYLQEIQNSRNINIYLNANVIEIEAVEDLKLAKRLNLACVNGVKFKVRAKAYILACGGQENARTLLLSNSQILAGLGNQNDLVGRYYMEHPKIDHGKVFIYEKNFNAPLLFGHRTAGGTAQFGIRLSDEVQKRENLLNHYILLQPQFVRDGRSDSRGFGWREKARYAYRKSTQKPLKFAYLLIKNYLEQVPRKDSRITLSREKDRLNLNRLKLDWKISTKEVQDMHRFHVLLNQYLKQQNIGEIQEMLPDRPPEKLPLFDSFHHIGATRMSHSPLEGVVDSNCQVHGLSNLYIAGTSVFPTGGYANSTLTAVALAIRLADHLKHETQR